jgi:hypothetical protein
MLVAAVGASAAFALDAATFLVSIACVGAIRYRGTPAAVGRGLGRELVGGLRYVAANSWLWATFAAPPPPTCSSSGAPRSCYRT